MNVWALKRRVVVYVILLSVLATIFFALVYLFFLDKDANCFDGLKNQNEIAIDCGGVCGGPCVIPGVSGKALWSRAFKLEDGVYSLGAYVEAGTLKFKAYDVPFEIEFYDKKGEYVNRYQGVVDLYPQVTNPVLVPNIDVGSREIARTQFRFTGLPKWQEFDKKAESFDLVISNEVIDNEGPVTKVYAQVTNADIRPVEQVLLYATVFDEKSNAIAMSQTFVNSIEPSESVDLTFSWPSKLTKNTQVCEAPVDLHILDLSNRDTEGEVEQYIEYLEGSIKEPSTLTFYSQDEGESEVDIFDIFKVSLVRALRNDTDKEQIVILVLNEYVDLDDLAEFNRFVINETSEYIALLLPSTDLQLQETVRSFLPDEESTYLSFDSEIAQKIIREKTASECEVDVAKVEILTKIDR